jgi:hypothetical protein
MRGRAGPVLIVAAILAAALPLPRVAVERVYSAGLYARLQPIATALSNQVPFALIDLLILVAVGWLAGATIVDFVKGPRLRAAGRSGLRAASVAAAAYFAFLVMWGLNYRRVPLVEKLPFDVSRLSSDTASRYAARAVDELNRLHDRAHAEGWPASFAIDPLLIDALQRADRSLGGPGRVVPGRPKASLADWYFRRASVAGMTDPFFLETLVESDLLPFERPFVVAHEWSHLAGLADEGEANFLGWLACVQASEPSQYSGWLFLYQELLATVRGRDRADVAARLGPGPRRDLQAVRARLAREVSPRVQSAGWQVYDRYLRANGVHAGAASYSEVVRFVLGVPLDAAWKPVR